MEENKKKELRVVFWHNDFPDGSRKNNFYGIDGPIFKKAQKKIKSELNLKWHFHGGFIHDERKMLLRRLSQADIIICGGAWNMDINDDNMHWEAAEHSLLKIILKLKEENKNMKVFFLQKPHHDISQFKKLGEILSDIHDETLFNYFKTK